MGFIKSVGNLFRKEWYAKKKKKYHYAKEMKRIAAYPRFTKGYAYIFEKPFKFHESSSFLSTYNELFIQDIYRFKPAGGKIILDCGANMGLSVLYFSMNYPDHSIIAFEPEEHIFKVLEENVRTFGLKNVTLIKKAVWTKDEQLKFYSDHGMGGRINVEYKDQVPVMIEAVALNNYLTTDVDFLKMDIEGAEDTVLRSCAGNLRKVKHIFFEYHNNVQLKPTLDQLLNLVKEEGFHYYVKESGVRRRPFVDEELICEKFDMALNIFCYKDKL